MRQDCSVSNKNRKFSKTLERTTRKLTNSANGKLGKVICFYIAVSNRISITVWLTTVLFHSTHNNVFVWIPEVFVFVWIQTISGGHYSGALFSVGGQGSIMIYTGNSDGVYTIYVTIVCTTVSIQASITSCKRVDGTKATTTLDLNKVQGINVCRTSKKCGNWSQIHVYTPHLINCILRYIYQFRL